MIILSLGSHSFGEISQLISPILLSLITIGCLWSGIRLQRHVINVQLGNSTLIRILMHLNFTMFLIVATYGLRALLVLTLYSGMASYYKKALEPISGVYISWIITTRWMPSIFCSLCLVNEMKRHGPNSSSSSSGSNTQFNSASTSIGDEDCPLDSMGHTLLHTDDADYHNPYHHHHHALFPPVLSSDEKFIIIHRNLTAPLHPSIWIHHLSYRTHPFYWRIAPTLRPSPTVGATIAIVCSN